MFGESAWHLPPPPPDKRGGELEPEACTFPCPGGSKARASPKTPRAQTRRRLRATRTSAMVSAVLHSRPSSFAAMCLSASAPVRAAEKLCLPGASKSVRAPNTRRRTANAIESSPPLAPPGCAAGPSPAGRSERSSAAARKQRNSRSSKVSTASMVQFAAAMAVCGPARPSSRTNAAAVWECNEVGGTLAEPSTSADQGPPSSKDNGAQTAANTKAAQAAKEGDRPQQPETLGAPVAILLKRIEAPTFQELVNRRDRTAPSATNVQPRITRP
mmetsp:Transcript_19634/g.53808  ORF Transcript_19634/g.53808 Transcript_19634/m.53808 type:complete len:272 (+) Transcript_19634:1092-1907(+)